MGYSMSFSHWRLSSSALAAAGLLFSSGAWASPELDAGSSPPDVAAAELSAAQAYDAFQRRDYASAVALYQKAFEAAPSADALFNIARVYDLGLRDRPLAITFYRRYVSDPGATPERIKRANERLTELREAEIAELTTRPTAPPAAQPAPAPPPIAVPAIAPLEQDAGSEWSSSTVAALTLGAAGAVALGVGVGFGVSLLSTAERANRECDGNECSSQRGVDAARAAARDARWANAGLAVGGGLLAGAAIVWLLDPGAEQAPPAAMKLSPTAGAGELGVALAGRW
jgi:tetratricopeptide (TPR) repeat protein